ncbi:uncharacterized protein V1516DRAFT_674277 [Lipomyces oligophaga]|uniref:uncharacterized protein n=1 Tax=Lipomyces oligophaga TaxID=45792 RepID=UPI0034CDDCF6
MEEINTTIPVTAQDLSTANALKLAKELKLQVFLLPTGYTPMVIKTPPEKTNHTYKCSQNPPTYIVRPHKPSTNQPPSTTCCNRFSIKNRIHKIPRPRNAFIIYRGQKHSQVMQSGELANTAASRIIAQMWKHESQEVKDHYKKLAEEERNHHKAMYPDYRYTPRRPGEKQRRRKRSQRPADEYDIDSDYPSVTSEETPGAENYEHNEIPQPYTPQLISNSNCDSPDGSLDNKSPVNATFENQYSMEQNFPLFNSVTVETGCNPGFYSENEIMDPVLEFLGGGKNIYVWN